MNEIPIEAKKDGLAQLQDGCWKLTLKVHLDDMPTWLMSAPMGTRLACAIVEIGDDEQPVPHEISPAKKAYQSKTEGEKAVTRAAMLCKDRQFRKWFMGFDHASESGAAEQLKTECGINSRAEFVTDSHAFKRFLEIEQEYHEATGQAAEPRT